MANKNKTFAKRFSILNLSWPSIMGGGGLVVVSGSKNFAHVITDDLKTTAVLEIYVM